MTDPSTAHLLDDLLETLYALSSTADEQAEHLERIGVPGVVDELALAFDDSLQHLPRLRLSGYISPEAETALSELLAMVSELPQEPDLWSLEGLQRGEWEVIRNAASNALRKLPRP